MVKKLFVGNLAFTTTEDELRNLFVQHGTIISAKLVNDRETGKSRGFGFVEMEDVDAEKAIAALNGQQINGRALRIDEARERTDRGNNRGGRFDRDRR
jgi:RNA recognition motif-containing protein